MTALPLRAVLARWLARRARRRSMLPLLRKPDDHLIEDIGLTRETLRVLLGAWHDGSSAAPPPRRRRPQPRRR